MCFVEDECSEARDLQPNVVHEQCLNILLQLVYVMWFDNRQLARGAKVSVKVSYTAL